MIGAKSQHISASILFLVCLSQIPQLYESALLNPWDRLFTLSGLLQKIKYLTKLKSGSFHYELSTITLQLLQTTSLLGIVQTHLCAHCVEEGRYNIKNLFQLTS